MIRMLIVGYAFGIRSGTGAVPGRSGEPGLSVVLWDFRLRTRLPDHSVLSRARNERFCDGAFSGAFSNASSEPVLRPAWLGARALRLMRA